jgi:hypothetical protein
MNTHNKQHHQQTNMQQPLACNICKKTFLKASSLNTHMITHTAKLYCYACNINFDDDAITYSQHMQVTHNVAMTKDLISRAKANLQRSESNNQQQLLMQQRQQQEELLKQKHEEYLKQMKVEEESEESDGEEEEGSENNGTIQEGVNEATLGQPQQQQQRVHEVFQVQSSSVTNGQIPKLKITIKKEPVAQEEEVAAHKEREQPTDGNLSDSSSSSSSSSSSGSSSSSSSSSSTTSNDNKN